MSKIKAAKAISFLWVGSLLGAGFAFLTQVFVARNLGVEDFGDFSSAMALVGILVPLAGFGLPQFWLKVFGEEGWGGARWLRGSLIFAALSTASVCLVIALWALLGAHDESAKKLLLMLIAFVVGQVSVELVSSKLQLEERYLYLAVWQFLPFLIRFLWVFAALVGLEKNFYFYGVGGAYLAAGILFFLVGLYQLNKLVKMEFNLVEHGVRGESFVAGSPSLKDIFLKSFPFGVAGLFHLIYFQGAILLLAYIVGAAEAGVYNVAFLIMSAVYLFPGVVYQKFLLPKIHRWSNQDRGLLYKSYRIGSIGMFWLGALASVCMWLLSPRLIPVLFGEEFYSSIDILCWLSLCAPLRFMATSVGSVLVAREHMLSKIKCMGGVAVVSVLLSLLLIPRYSIGGALFVAILSEALLLVLYFYLARTRVFGFRV